MVILDVENVSKSFKGNRVLHEISCQIHDGSVVGIIGPNGAGKTTLFNIIGRYYKPDEGEILFRGRSISSLSPDRLLNLGISRGFQDVDFQPNQTVLESSFLGFQKDSGMNLFRELSDPSFLKTLDKRLRRQIRDFMRLFESLRLEAESAQDSLGFPDLKGRGGYPDLIDVCNTPINTLPYGIRKLADTLRALVSQPQLLLLDEPTSGLGDQSIELVKGILSHLSENLNTTVLIIEHKVPLIMEVCDEVIVLNYGHLVKKGTPEEVKADPKVIEAYLGKQVNKSKILDQVKSVESEEKQNHDVSQQLDFDQVIDISDLDVSFGAVKALTKVTTKFANHRVYGVLGSNGAGKSTFLKTIAGLYRPDHGKIEFLGEVIVDWLHEPRPDIICRQGISLVPEGRQIFKELSVYENLKLATSTIRGRSNRKRAIEKTLHYFPKLKECLKVRDSGNLSGGQQQMLAIAMSLIVSPTVLMLDEPSLGLAPMLVEEIFEVVNSYSIEQNCKLIIVEQSVNLILDYAEYFYFIDSGYLMVEGSKDLIMNNQIVKNTIFGD